MKPTMPFRFNPEHAAFDEFIYQGRRGACFVGSSWGKPRTLLRHRERIWPALSRYKRKRSKRRRRFWPWPSARHTIMTKRMGKASLLTVLRRWYPMHPLELYHLQMCDRAQRPPHNDP